MLNETIPNLARRVADCTIQREGVLTKGWHYDSAVVWRGMEQVYFLTKDIRYLDYIRDAVDHFVDAQGQLSDYDMSTYNLDSICAGRQLLFLYRETGDERYLRAAALVREQFRHHPRNDDGGLWHKQIYPHQMWLDGLHMAMPFYTEYALITGETDILEDVALQFKLAYRHTYDPATGLNRHGYDDARKQPWASPVTGQSSHAWARAMGWYLLGIVDTLEIMQKYGRKPDPELLDIFAAMAQKVMSVRVDGLWMQVLDCPDRIGNYLESSAAFLILCAVLKGVRLGFLDQQMGPDALASYHQAVRHFIGQMTNGQLFVAKCCQVAGLGGAGGRDGSFDYYISEPVTSYDLKATGAMIQAACEAEWMEQKA